jgi:hypothetical protein
MTRLARLACPVVILAALFSTPAKAQFGGLDMSQMQQFAPMLETMKQKMGKRRFGQMMRMMGPMMERMQSQGGFSPGGFSAMTGGFGGGAPMGGMDIGQIMGMVGSMKGLMGSRQARRQRG